MNMEPQEVASPSAPYARRDDDHEAANASTEKHGQHREDQSALRFVPLLLRKNWWLKKKSPFSLLLEILAPVLCVAAMSAVKHATPEYAVPTGFSADDKAFNLFQQDGGDGNALIAPSFAARYAVPETTLTGLMLHMNKLSFEFAREMTTFTTEDSAACKQQVVYGGRVSLDTSSQFALPEVCGGRVSPLKIAIVPDVPFTRQYFYETVAKWYPTLTLNLSVNETLVVPSFQDSVVFYPTEKDLEAYIKSKEYASRESQPRVFGAIVFDEFPEEAKLGKYASIEYTVRLNSTFIVEGQDARYVPETVSSDASTWDALQRDIDTTLYQQYASGGFMTLQTLVSRFVNCMPGWDASSKSTTGECQAKNSVATDSAEIDSRLLKAATKDPATQQIVKELVQGRSLAASKEIDLALILSDAQKEALVKPLRQAPQPYLGALTTPFPIEAYAKSTFYQIIEGLFPIIFLVTYLFPLSKILVSLISERETRARELMKILGVNEVSIVVSWFITYVVILLVSSILQVIAASTGLFESSNVIVIFLFFFLFNLSILAYAFMVSAVFTKATTGTYVGIIGFFVLYAVSNAFTGSSPEASKNAVSLLAPSAMAFAVQTFAEAETTHVGIQFGNVSAVIKNYRLSASLWFFALDTVLYTLLGLYLERVVPKMYGTPEKWYFPFSPSYWRRRRDRVQQDRSAKNVGNSDEGVVTVPTNPNIELVGADLMEQERNGTALCVQGLRKVFAVPGGEKVAVNDVHLNMYSGQITCLLGHNGAGKTTLISMLTGMLEPTAGDASFRGKSVRHDMNELRGSLGICFQHDVLYPTLTVAEHLDFYARIKGFSGAALAAEIDSKIVEVGLTDKRNVASSALSGGMKRKLSVAISLLGGSSLVFLDEPTSGMDPYSRRSTWEILMNNRHDRVLVLTTHFMDEADILGDRIAIMASGELRCCGSPLFLKNRYGVGYNLTMVKQEGRHDSDVVDFVLDRIPSGSVLSNVGTEVAFQLPLDASAQFPELFRSLDIQLESLGVLSYGISVTTMEEVFIKVAAEDAEHQTELIDKTKQTKEDTSDYGTIVAITKSSVSNGSTKSPKVMRLKANALFRQQLWAIFQKRFRIAKRDQKYGFVSVFLPVCMLIFGLSLLKAGTITKPDRKIALSSEGLRQKVSTKQLLVPSCCQQTVGDLCASTLNPSTFFSVAIPVQVDAATIKNPPFASDTPTVFNVTYSDPSLDWTDAPGFMLQLSQIVHDEGYRQARVGQFAGLLVHADTATRMLSYNLLVNTTVPHGSVLFKSLMDQSIYRIFAKQVEPSIDVSSLSLKVNNSPLPRTKSTAALLSGFLAFSTCFFIALSFGFYPASIVVFLVKERHPDHNSKHQQLVSGVNLVAFWLGNYLWDLLVYVIPGATALILIQAYDIASLAGSAQCLNCTSDTFTVVVLLFVLFGFAVCSFAYFLSFLFTDYNTALTKTVLLNMVFGLALMIISRVFDRVESTKDVNRVLKWFFRFSPIYSLSIALLDLTVLEILNSGGGEFNSKQQSLDPFALENAGYELVFLGISAVLYFVLAVGIDYALTFPTFKTILAKDPQIPVRVGVLDIDVAAEVERVASGRADSNVVKLQELRKVYQKDSKVAVHNLSFGLAKGECFGFLGINGAGKTTTMKMLTGDIVPTAGNATLASYDLLREQLLIRQEMGYCPQFDALHELLTVREHLELFALVKGIAKRDVEAVVVEKMAQISLLPYENKLAGTLSGGTKRKLSVAIAMIGSPSILFLDEPSTGMDPVSRRFMWDVIAQVSTVSKEATVVLTTHSMEECEALCTRVGIMVDGGLKCFGSIQHLKTRFGDGLMLDAKLAAPLNSEIHDFTTLQYESVDARITRDQVEEACVRFGNAGWAAKIVSSHPTGFMIAQALDCDGYVLAVTLSAWWVSEARFENLFQFLMDSFGADVKVLERQNDSCCFKIPDVADHVTGSARLKLAAVFQAIETAKDTLSIREYSVTQTSLEQIINMFASAQAAQIVAAPSPTTKKQSTSFLGLLT